jgi:hypothetical protein
MMDEMLDIARALMVNAKNPQDGSDRILARQSGFILTLAKLLFFLWIRSLGFRLRVDHHYSDRVRG